MARIRSIKPAFFRHRRLFVVEQESGLPLRVAFAGLWTCADREGRFKWEPDELKLDCLPYDKVEFIEVLSWLALRDFVRLYVVDGRAYGCIPGFKDHQIVNHREAESELPAPDALTTVEGAAAYSMFMGEPPVSDSSARTRHGSLTRAPRVPHASSPSKILPGHARGEQEQEQEQEQEVIPPASADGEPPEDSRSQEAGPEQSPKGKDKVPVPNADPEKRLRASPDCVHLLAYLEAQVVAKFPEIKFPQFVPKHDVINGHRLLKDYPLQRLKFTIYWAILSNTHWSTRLNSLTVLHTNVRELISKSKADWDTIGNDPSAWGGAT